MKVTEMPEHSLALPTQAALSFKHSVLLEISSVLWNMLDAGSLNIKAHSAPTDHADSPCLSQIEWVCPPRAGARYPTPMLRLR